MRLLGRPWVLMPALLLAFLTPARADDATYRAEIERWRTQREERLKADGGWLTVTGLFWLHEGANPFGSGPANEIVLPGVAPARAGTFVLKQGRVTVEPEPNLGATVGGQPLSARELKPDTSGSPDVISLGRLTMHVIHRGQRFGIRLKDMDSAARKAFHGLEWFPVDESYRVTARFVPYSPPRPIAVPNVLGEVEEMPSPGHVVFTLDGKEVQLEPVLESSDRDELFFIFRDQTSGKGTYPAGRFLYSALPRDGSVVLDFNKAYNPPCAFTEFATCPLPPKKNRMDVRLTAGEKDYRHH